MTRHLATRASRRGALGLLVGITAAGCSLDPPSDEPSGASPSADAEGTAPAEDPDTELVRHVVDDLTAALALVGGIARGGRSLTAVVAPWRELHAAHLEALEAPDRARPERVRGPLPALRNRLRREETGLQRRLAEAAVAAQSGALAALLATMAAAVAQQLAADAAGGS